MTDASASSGLRAVLDDRAEVFVDIALLGVMWILTEIAVNASGNFPLNDDWAYVLTLRHLIDSGDYHPLENTTMTLVTNVIWGALFCLPGGLNFTALRFSTLVAAFLGMVGVYCFVREFRQSRGLALCAAMTVAFSPIYFALSYTFMTDVLFAAMSIWAAWFFSRNLRTGAASDWILGTTLAVIATLSRQLGICIPLAFCVIRLMVPQPCGKRVVTAILPALTCVGVLIAFLHWLSVTDRLPTLFGLQANSLVHSLIDIELVIGNLSDNAFVATVYIGLFLLPLLILSAWPPLRTGILREYMAISIGILAIAGGLIARLSTGRPILMPLSSNILVGSGIGPLTLRDTYILKLDDIPSLPHGFWYVVTILSLIGGALLIARLIVALVELIEALRLSRHVAPLESSSPFMLLCGGVYLLPLLFAPAIFDRYLIPATIFFALGISTGTAGQPRSASAFNPALLLAYTIIGVFCLFSAAGTHDYLAWNRLRWIALQELTQKKHVPATEIDGGYEFNGFLLYDPNYDVMAHLNDTHRSYWWVQNDTYMIAFGPVPGYSVISQYTDQSWLGQPHRITVLRKD